MSFKYIRRPSEETIMLENRETADERRNRENYFWSGVRERRAVLRGDQKEPRLDPEAINFAPMSYWWNGYQAGAV